MYLLCKFMAHAETQGYRPVFSHTSSQFSQNFNSDHLDCKTYFKNHIVKVSFLSLSNNKGHFPQIQSIITHFYHYQMKLW